MVVWPDGIHHAIQNVVDMGEGLMITGNGRDHLRPRKTQT